MIFYEEYKNVRQKELLAEAERDRLVNKFNQSPIPSKPNFSRMVTWLGNLLLTWGTWLTLRFEENTMLTEPESISKS
jgi:hypothetical protein